VEDSKEIQQGLVPAEDVPGEAEVISPVEQETVLFYGKPLKVVRLPDGRPGVVMRYLCDNMHLDRSSQVRRIQRTKAIAKDLVYCYIDTESGVQKMPTLILRSLTYWLLGIDPGRARPDMQADILRYQEEAVDVLYAWAQSSTALMAPSPSLPTEIPGKPSAEPGPDASKAELASYHEAMALWHRWQADRYMQAWRNDLEAWRGNIESHLEGEQALLALIPEILERLPPQTLSVQHQRAVQVSVRKLVETTGKSPNTIYEDLRTAFDVPRYTEILESDWDQITRWFAVQLERAKGKKGR
jgi:hypothetical protein